MAKNKYWVRRCKNKNCFGLARPLSDYCNRCYLKRKKKFEKPTDKLKYEGVYCKNTKMVDFKCPDCKKINKTGDSVIFIRCECGARCLRKHIINIP